MNCSSGADRACAMVGECGGGVLGDVTEVLRGS